MHHFKCVDLNISILLNFQSNIYYSTYASGRDEQLYKDAEKFDPDRWGSSDINAFAQLPFGFGPRSCYGNVV